MVHDVVDILGRLSAPTFAERRHSQIHGPETPRPFGRVKCLVVFLASGIVVDVWAAPFRVQRFNFPLGAF